MPINIKKERAECIPRDEHIIAMKSRKDEFLSEMKLHLTKGLGDLKRSHVAEIQSLKMESDETVARLEADRQHFVKALAESMNEVTQLRNRHGDVEEEEYADQGEHEDDGLHRWHDAAGVGGLEDSGHGAVLPLAPPPVKTGPPPLGPDLVSAAHRAAR
ncbi:MAG: hypothetical protein ACKPKO_37460, partial [Candidatus Fonsibacter sp.]